MTVTDNAVAEKWKKRLKDYKSSFHGSFMSAFAEQLNNPKSLEHKAGSRTVLPKALEAGIAAMVSEVFGPDCKPEKPCHSLPCEIIGAKKSADISFDIKNIKLVFEVKTSLEFNSLAAAGAEALLFKKYPSVEDAGKNIVFVLLSLAGKGDYDTVKATSIAEKIFIFNEKSCIDRIFVLSLEAGSPKEKDNPKLCSEIQESLQKFKNYLVEVKHTLR